MKKLLLRSLVVTHRYLGIAIGWLMLMWCLSGMVMLYVSYPDVGATERWAGLGALSTAQCCHSPAELDAEQKVYGFNVEMLGDRPVLRLAMGFGASQLIDLQRGEVVESLTSDDALAVAHAVERNGTVGGQSTPSLLGAIDHDQWTVNSDERRRPLFHIALNDPSVTELYVSSVDGTLVQRTTRTQRFWNWVGAIPHWLYPTVLREHGLWWTRAVIWSATLGSFLTLFGLALGVWRLRRRADGQWHSPYRGWRYWHHVPGLVFGVLLLSWVVSGLLSMNPWGLLESEGGAREARTVAGTVPTWANVQAVIDELPQAQLPTNTVALDSQALHGELYVMATTRSGERIRLDRHWQVAPLRDVEIREAVTALGINGAAAELLQHEDPYYYGQGSEHVSLPVWRAIALNEAGKQTVRYYFDSVSGALLRKIDNNARWYRWLHSGFHRMDFVAAMRARPLWDLLVWFLLAGITVVSATGTWLAVKYLRGYK